MAGSRSLHDAVHAVLDAVPELIRSRTSVTAHCLLAAMADAPGERLLGVPAPTGGGSASHSAAAAAALASAGGSNSNSASSSSRRVLRSPVALFCKRAVEGAAGLSTASTPADGASASQIGGPTVAASAAGEAGDMLPHTQSLELQHAQLSSIAGASTAYCSQPRPSRVRAVRLPLPRTLLLQAMK